MNRSRTGARGTWVAIVMAAAAAAVSVAPVTSAAAAVGGFATGTASVVTADVEPSPSATPTPTPDPGAVSVPVVWSCTSGPCPWGEQTSGNAAVWPAGTGSVSSRLGYTVSEAIYLPAEQANGDLLTVTEGSASVYAGAPDAGSHRWLATLSAGDSFAVSGLLAGEVISMQNDGGAFRWTRVAGDAPTPEPTPTPDPSPTPSPTPTPTPTPTGTVSVPVVWSCTSGPCPWGDQTSGNAAVWPAAAGPVSSRLGYTVSEAIYLPAEQANGDVLTVTEGSASVYAGAPDAGSHHWLATLSAGDSFTVSDLLAGEVLSMQNDGGAFRWTRVAGDAPTPEPTPTPTPTPTPSPTPSPTPTGPCTDPTSCDVVDSVLALWQCNAAGCEGDPWVGGAITWPAWSAYSNNGRSGNNSRTVYDLEGDVLHPYMGAWADGCQVTVVDGILLVIEWERGTDVWRATHVYPGQTHTIDLTGPENSAMLETPDDPTTFRVSLENCTPQPLP